MSVPSGVILIWPGTNASIPSGWTRETTLDDKYPKSTAASVEPNVTGGSHAHTHTSSAHTHTMSSHSHSGDTANDTAGADDAGGGGTQASRDAHHHAYNFAGVTGGSLSDAITYASVNGEPPYHAVIFIKPSGATATVADDVACFYTQATAPTGWTYCDGTSTTPNLANKYLKGATTGADSGTTGGGTTHAHTVNHTHSSKTHTHAGTTGVDSDQGSRDTQGAGGSVTIANHTHTLTLSADAGQTGTAYTGTAGSAETVEVAYKKVGVIQNTSGTVNQPPRIVGLWLGALASIPTNWTLCDGTLNTTDLRDTFIKVGADLTEVADTGGANTHTHAASNSHAHTGSSHTHTGSTSTVSASLSTGAGGGGCAKTHSHTSSASSAGTAGWGSTTISAASSSNEPGYRTAAYIQYKGGAGGGFLFYNLM